jgi:anti-sigma-K factor RskA
MDGIVSHDEIAELLGAYALDAVEADEASAIELHLRDCPRCTAELAQHHAVAALLANAGSNASVELWDRIAASLDPVGEPPPAAVVMDAALADALPRRLSERRRRIRWSAAGAIAAVAAAVIALLAVQVNHLDGRVTSPQQAALAALHDPHHRLVALKSPSATTVADLVVLPSGTAYVINHHLRALSSHQTYQLWGEEQGRTVSLGLLGNRPQTVPMTVGDEALITAYAVTTEPAGGVVAPTHVPVATGTLHRA